jgi:hypothetical protein
MSGTRTLAFRAAIVGLVVAALLTWGDFALRAFLPAIQAPHWPNPAYWVAARLAVEGNAGLIYADRDVFFQQTERLGTVHDIFEANMPTSVLTFLPLGPLSETTARNITDVAMLVAYIVACALLFRALTLPPLIALGLWVLVPVFHPWRENISRGQIYPLVLMLLVLGSIIGLRRYSGQTQPDSARYRALEIASGFVLGLLAIVKLYYAALMLPALIARRWWLLASAAVTFALAALVTVALWGGELWSRAIGFAVTWRDRPESGVTAYQTLNSWLTHLLRYDPTWNPGPIANIPGLVGWLWLAGAAILVVLTCALLWIWWAARPATPAQLLLGFALVVPVALVLAPIAEDYHFVLALLPLVVAGKLLWDSTEYRVPSDDRYELRTTHNSLRITRYALLLWIGLLAAALLIGAPWRFNVPDVEGWNALLYYPRLYGAIVLWLVVTGLIIVMRRSAASRNQGISAP